MLELRHVLFLLGLDIDGWQLERAVAISADGKTILGSGVNPSGEEEAWLAVVPEIPAVAAPALQPAALFALVGLLLLGGWLALESRRPIRRQG